MDVATVETSRTCPCCDAVLLNDEFRHIHMLFCLKLNYIRPKNYLEIVAPDSNKESSSDKNDEAQLLNESDEESGYKAENDQSPSSASESRSSLTSNDSVLGKEEKTADPALDSPSVPLTYANDNEEWVETDSFCDKRVDSDTPNDTDTELERGEIIGAEEGRKDDERCSLEEQKNEGINTEIKFNQAMGGLEQYRKQFSEEKGRSEGKTENKSAGKWAVKRKFRAANFRPYRTVGHRLLKKSLLTLKSTQYPNAESTKRKEKLNSYALEASTVPLPVYTASHVRELFACLTSKATKSLRRMNVECFQLKDHNEPGRFVDSEVPTGTPPKLKGSGAEPPMYIRNEKEFQSRRRMADSFDWRVKKMQVCSDDLPQCLAKNLVHLMTNVSLTNDHPLRPKQVLRGKTSGQLPKAGGRQPNAFAYFALDRVQEQMKTKGKKMEQHVQQVQNKYSSVGST